MDHAELRHKLSEEFLSKESPYSYYPSPRPEDVLHVFRTTIATTPAFKALPFTVPPNCTELVIVFKELAVDDLYMYQISMHAKCKTDAFSYWKEITLDGAPQKARTFDYEYVNDRVGYSDITRDVFDALRETRDMYLGHVPTMAYGTIVDALVDIVDTLAPTYASTKPCDALVEACAKPCVAIPEHYNIPLHRIDEGIATIAPSAGSFKIKMEGPVSKEAIRALYACASYEEPYATLYHYLSAIDEFQPPRGDEWYECANVMNRRIFNRACDMTRGNTFIPYSVTFAYDGNRDITVEIGDFTHEVESQLCINTFHEKVRAVCKACHDACIGAKDKIVLQGDGPIASFVRDTIDDLFYSKHVEYDEETILSGVWDTAPVNLDVWGLVRVRMAHPIDSYKFLADFEKLLFLFSAKEPGQTTWPVSMCFGKSVQIQRKAPHVIVNGVVHDFPGIEEIIPTVPHDVEEYELRRWVRVPRNFFGKGYETHRETIGMLGNLVRLILKRTTYSVKMGSKTLYMKDLAHRNRVLGAMKALMRYQ